MGRPVLCYQEEVRLPDCLSWAAQSALAVAATTLTLATAAVAQPAAALAIAAAAFAITATAAAKPAAVAAAVATAALAALHLHADERLPFMGRCRRRLSGGGPAVGERAVRGAERAAAHRCGWQ